MKIPSNLIVENKYTIGKEFMYLRTYREYQGYYYELSSKFYAGATYNPNSLELVRIEPENINTLLTRPSTYVYGVLSKAKIDNPKVSGVISSNLYDKVPETIVFYCKKININPILIRQISEQTYINIKNNPLYVVTYIGTYNGIQKNIDDASKQIPELENWLLSGQTF